MILGSVYPTSCNKPVKQWHCYNRIELWLQISSQRILVEHLAGSMEPQLKTLHYKYILWK